MKKHIAVLAGVTLAISALPLAGCKEEGKTEVAVQQTAQPAAPQASAAQPAATPATPAETAGASGEELYNQHCRVCHPNGGNVIKPEYTLQKASLDARGIKTVEDIVAKMRNPGPGMAKFDPQTISDADAKKIAEFVMETYK